MKNIVRWASLGLLGLGLALVSAACAGPTGPAGPLGPQGAAGPAGPAGSAGKDGEPGQSFVVPGPGLKDRKSVV